MTSSSSKLNINIKYIVIRIIKHILIHSYWVGCGGIVYYNLILHLLSPHQPKYKHSQCALYNYVQTQYILDFP